MSQNTYQPVATTNNSSGDFYSRVATNGNCSFDHQGGPATKGENDLSSPHSSSSSNDYDKKRIHSVVTKQGQNLVFDKPIAQHKMYSMSEPLYSQSLNNKDGRESPEKSVGKQQIVKDKNDEKLKKEVFKRLKKYRIIHGLEKSLGLDENDLMKYMENWESKMPPPPQMPSFMMVSPSNYMTSAPLTNFGSYNLFNNGFNNR